MFLSGVIVSEERDLLGVALSDRLRTAEGFVAFRVLFIWFGFSSFRVICVARVCGYIPTSMRALHISLSLPVTRKYIPDLELEIKRYQN